MENIYTLMLMSKGIHEKEGIRLLQLGFRKEKIEYTSIFLITIAKCESTEGLVNACKSMGFLKEKVYVSSDYEDIENKELPEVDAIYVTQGNAFDIMRYIIKHRFDTYIKQSVKNGSVYIGSSAGVVLASMDIKLAEEFDENKVGDKNYVGLDLLPDGEIIIPHYTYKEKTRFVDALLEEQRYCYSSIDNCSESELLVMRVKEDKGRKILKAKKRIR